jgi:hypothetical protein
MTWPTRSLLDASDCIALLTQWTLVQCADAVRCDGTRKAPVSVRGATVRCESHSSTFADECVRITIPEVFDRPGSRHRGGGDQVGAAQDVGGKPAGSVSRCATGLDHITPVRVSRPVALGPGSIH